jgi:hypothetical protein
VISAVLALAALLDGFAVRRASWLKSNWHLDVTLSEDFNDPVLTRVNADDTLWPWGPTEDDLFAGDWEFVTGEGTEAVGVRPGSFPWALGEMWTGRRVRLAPGSPLVLERAEAFGAPCIALVLPNGQRRVWRPQHQDLRREDYGPAT